MKKLYIGNLSFSTTDASLSSAFEKFGPVVSCNIIKDRDTNESKGFAFLELENDENALEAIKQLNGTMVDGRELRVSEARPKEDRQGGGSGSRNGFSSQRSY